MVYRVVLALCAFILVTAPGNTGPRLSPAEINALAPGVYVGSWKEKKELHLTLDKDGTVSGTVDGRYHVGTWYVSDEEFCIEFTIIIFEKTKCDSIYREGDWLVSYSKKGKVRIRLKLVDQFEPS
jgi:hypothetical protein